eukprot:scpid103140/ scgid16888/ 
MTYGGRRVEREHFVVPINSTHELVVILNEGQLVHHPTLTALFPGSDGMRCAWATGCRLPLCHAAYTNKRPPELRLTNSPFFNPLLFAVRFGNPERFLLTLPQAAVRLSERYCARMASAAVLSNKQISTSSFFAICTSLMFSRHTVLAEHISASREALSLLTYMMKLNSEGVVVAR